MSKVRHPEPPAPAALATPTELPADAGGDISAALNPLVADMFETFIDQAERRTWFLFEATSSEGS
jgi:hypothetical protein